jgi:hypothetical protein
MHERMITALQPTGSSKSYCFTVETQKSGERAPNAIALGSGKLCRARAVRMAVTPPDPDPMIVSLLRLFALRPLLTLALFGIPIIVLVAVGLFTILALKLFFFIVLPILVVVWLVRKVTRSGDEPAN